MNIALSGMIKEVHVVPPEVWASTERRTNVIHPCLDVNTTGHKTVRSQLKLYFSELISRKRADTDTDLQLIRIHFVTGTDTPPPRPPFFPVLLGIY